MGGGSANASLVRKREQRGAAATAVQVRGVKIISPLMENVLCFCFIV